MKKVLHIGIGEHFGGIAKLNLEYVKNINNFQIDVLTPNKKYFTYFEKNLKKYKSNLYDLNITKMTRKNEIIYDYRLYKFLKNNKYDIIHINSDIFFFSFRVLLISKICKVKKIVMHTHGTQKVNPIKRLLINVLNPLYRSMIDEYLTCSKQAESSLYTKKFIKKNKVKLLKNGININAFKFNEKYRIEYQKKLNIESKNVYCHIGRFKKVKNHEKLIDIFYEIQKQDSNSVLLLIGDGVLLNQIKEKVNNLKIDDKVLFLGFRDDINKILNAVDVLIFPSFHEGLGITLIEAQTNGVLVFSSDTIPIEAKLSNNFYYFNINDKNIDIANRIINQKNNINHRNDAYKCAIENGYDIKDVCKKLEDIYLNI